MTRSLVLPLLVLLTFGGCAATSATTRDQASALTACSLEDEMACVAYADALPESPDTPFGKLIIGLADRAAQLDGDAARPYHRRIVNLQRTATSYDPAVASRAARSFVVIAALKAERLRDFEWEDGEALSLQKRVETLNDTQREIREFATFAINNGDPPTQAEAGWLITYGYERQAELLRKVEIPPELNAPAEVAFREQLDELIESLEAEGARFRGALLRHCRQHRLELRICS